MSQAKTIQTQNTDLQGYLNKTKKW